MILFTLVRFFTQASNEDSWKKCSMMNFSSKTEIWYEIPRSSFEQRYIEYCTQQYLVDRCMEARKMESEICSAKEKAQIKNRDLVKPLILQNRQILMSPKTFSIWKSTMIGIATAQIISFRPLSSKLHGQSYYVILIYYNDFILQPI